MQHLYFKTGKPPAYTHHKIKLFSNSEPAYWYRDNSNAGKKHIRTEPYRTALIASETQTIPII